MVWERERNTVLPKLNFHSQQSIHLVSQRVFETPQKTSFKTVYVTNYQKIINVEEKSGYFIFMKIETRIAVTFFKTVIFDPSA